jgi:hypothetical protein
MVTNEQILNNQIKAYNSKNVMAFANCFTEDIEIYEFDNKIRFKGKQPLISFYNNRFINAKVLNCEIVNRIVIKNIIIDYEIITGIDNSDKIETVVRYEFNNSLICRVDFLL